MKKEKIIKQKVITDSKEEINHKSITNALYKKAVGYESKEVVEEYVDVGENGEKVLKLNKRKITSRHVSPDISAVKIVLELLKERGYEDYTDEELVAERDRLLEILNNQKEEEKNYDFGEDNP